MGLNICYLSSSDLGKKMYSFLKDQNCIISFSEVENKKVNFENIDYDLGISFLYTHKIPESEFIKNKKWLNFHPGPLPDYKGRNLCYHAIMNGATEFGASLHYMDKEFDTGDIIDVLTFPVEKYFTAGDLSRLSKNALVSLFEKYIPLFIEGKNIKGQKQTHTGKYFRKDPIDEQIILPKEDQLRVKAITASPNFYAHTIIDGKKYFIIPEQDKNNL
jgi:Methionyl-tRNA formyltransferase